MDRVSPLAAARRLMRDGEPDAAVATLFAATDETPDDPALKVTLSRLLLGFRGTIDPAREAQLHAMLIDPDLEPSEIEYAGWAMLAAAGRLPGTDAAMESAARQLEGDGFVRALLEQCWATHPAAELSLTPVRRWLLLSGRAVEFPRIAEALVRQAAHTGGAWLFDEEERERFAADPFAAAYLPPRPVSSTPVAKDNAIARAVSAQYEAWPYPPWSRTAIGTGGSVANYIRGLGPGAPEAMPEDAAVLSAGCGTGHEPLSWARRFPALNITAIDISSASLAYATARRDAMGVTNVSFEQRDLHDVAGLGRQFDMVVSSGVLHHLADPEAGWAAITGALKPGGVMRVMLYSRIARLPILAARRRIADLLDRPVDDDLLRAIRAQLMQGPVDSILRSPDFYNLGGLHDLVLHNHEDPFDVPRIRRAIEGLGLDFLGFALPSPAHRARYLARNPEDRWVRDFDAVARFELSEPSAFGNMYDLWCVKPA